MSTGNSTAPDEPDKAAKPSKPRPDCPLFPRAAGVWAKKVRGTMRYFGPWSEPAALEKHRVQKDALQAGRKSVF